MKVTLTKEELMKAIGDYAAKNVAKVKGGDYTVNVVLNITHSTGNPDGLSADVEITPKD